MGKSKSQLDRDIAIAISDRRIAALRANGEDKRNTPAWRDAMSERRMINIMTSKRPSKPKVSSDERVAITWYVIPNTNTRAGGFLPVYSVDGKQRGDTYGRGYDKATAERMAEEMAHAEAARYIGDWDVTVKKGP